MSMVPPRFIPPVRTDSQNRPILPYEPELEAFNKFTRTIPGQEPLTWNMALLQNMGKPYQPKPEYDEMLLVPYMEL